MSAPDGASGVSWNFTSLCGDEGIQIWNAARNDIGICFQQLFMDIPVLGLLAIFSSYYLGRQDGLVARGRSQLLAINLRCVLTAFLAILPLVQLYVFRFETPEKLPQIGYFLSAVQGLAWFVHLLYNMSLRKKLGKSPRGPMIICVLWSLIFVLTVISLRSHFLILKYVEKPQYSHYLAYGMSVCYLIVQVFYAISLIPGEGETTYLNFVDSYTEIGESQALLGSAYVRFREEGDPSYLGVAMENVSWLSRLLFSWVEPLMQKGVHGQLRNVEDLYDLPVSLNCAAISNELHNAMKNHRAVHELHSFADEVRIEKKDFTLVKALHRVFWVEFYSVGILKLIADLAGFGGPMLLNRLITFIEDKSENISWGYLYAAGLLSTTLIGSLCDCHFNFLIAKVSFRMRSAIVTLIYKKTLSVNPASLNSQFSVGEIVNFMSTDTDRIVNSCPSFHALWSIPFQLAVSLYLLYSQVGLAFLAGVIFSVILIPVNEAIANKIGDLSTKLMEQKDRRVKIITEVLRGIRAVKLYVWEDHFVRHISRIRTQELKYLKGRKYLDALCVYFWATTPVIICILTFVTYSLLGNKLTAATVFTSVALLNMLIAPLNAFPWVLNGMIEAWVSVKRIQKLLQLPDQDLDSYYQPVEDDSYDIIMKNAGFSYGKEMTSEEKQNLHKHSTQKSLKGKGTGKNRRVAFDNGQGSSGSSQGEKFCLKGINLKIRKGEFIGIMGPVGCGKSSILSAILAELSMQSGEISISQIESGFGYVTQQPWLQRGTVRDNILFGKPYDEKKYWEVLFACGLVADISALPKGDMTGVGESGMTLSGGQKTRVALARAVYQDKSVYLLDDILSAVDRNVAKHIFEHCIMGLLKDKTKVLCTHHVHFLAHAERILIIEDGVIKKQGKTSDILPTIDDSIVIDLELGESVRSSYSNSLLESAKISPIKGSEKDNDSILNAEVSEAGSLRFSVWASYWKAIGHLLCLSVLLAIILMQISRNLTDWWLAQWVNNAESINSTNNISMQEISGSEHIYVDSVRTVTDTTSSFMKVYVELAMVNTLFTLLRAFLFAYGGIVAAGRFHKLLLKSVIKAKTTFFDITPLGRILNRFSSDTYTVDDSLPFILNILLAQFFGLLGSIGITVYGLPWICLFLVPLIPVYHWLQNYYRLTSRELKRISSVSLSPVYSHFNETLQGLTTINAMRATQRFKRENQEYVDTNIKAQFASQIAIRWLGLRLQFIGVAIVTGVSFIAVIQHQYQMANPGFIGLAISYALTVTGLLSGVVNAFTETEREMIAVERVNQYVNEIDLEPTYYATEPPFGWPSQGVLTFNEVSLRYREHLMPSIKNVTFETRPSEKIGVVGRTGSGKSSIIAALFRMAEISSGEICIDSVNISRIAIPTLRSRLFCIPQDPFLFSGTIRENLDPLDEFRDNEIWSALSKVHLEGSIKKMGGLTSAVEEGGSNFSVGQKQLICLARAVLHNSKVICIDEATANIDQDTDRQIQLILRSAFRKSTVITIAHRIQTILDSDRVLVMQEGKAVEFDSPENLLNDTGSRFYQLVNQDA